jgi:hypothetical protein
LREKGKKLFFASICYKLFSMHAIYFLKTIDFLSNVTAGKVLNF